MAAIQAGEVADWITQANKRTVIAEAGIAELIATKY